MKLRDLLVKVADYLDRNGEVELADQVDQTLNNSEAEEFEVEIPAAEKLMLEDVLFSLQRSLE